MPNPELTQGEGRTSPEVAAGPSGVPADNRAPNEAAEVASPDNGGISEPEVGGGLLPPSHWTQLAEVGDHQQSAAFPLLLCLAKNRALWLIVSCHRINDWKMTTTQLLETRLVRQTQ